MDREYNWPTKPLQLDKLALRAPAQSLSPAAAGGAVLLRPRGPDRLHADQPGGQEVWCPGRQGAALVGDHRSVRAQPAVHHRHDAADGGPAGRAVHLQPSRRRQRDHRHAGERHQRLPDPGPGARLGHVHGFLQPRLRRSGPAPKQRPPPLPAHRYRAEEGCLRPARAGHQRGPPFQVLHPGEPDRRRDRAPEGSDDL